MNVTVAKNRLHRALGQLKQVAANKTTMPILASVIIEAKGKALRLSATDLNLALATSIPCDVSKPGTVAVPVSELLARVGAMPDGDLTMALDKHGAVAITAAGSARRFTLRAHSGEDFPPLPVARKDGWSATCTAGELVGAIAQEVHAVSLDETRSHINSALFEWCGGALRVVATDGHRLAKHERGDVTTIESSLLIPLRGLLALRHLCDGHAADVSVSVTRSESVAFFTIGETTLSTKMADAQFPPYEKVIPTTSLHEARIPRAAFVSSLLAVQIASETTKQGGVTLTFSDGKLRVDAESPDAGNATDEIAIDYTGPTRKIGVNAKYWVTPLSLLSEEDVVMSFGNELDPMMVCVANSEQQRQQCIVVMPMRL